MTAHEQPLRLLPQATERIRVTVFAAPSPEPAPSPRPDERTACHRAPEDDGTPQVAGWWQRRRRGRHAHPDSEDAVALSDADATPGEEDPLAWLGFRFVAD